MKFTELSKERQQELIEKYCEGQHEFFDGSAVTEDWEQILNYLGFLDVNIHWSGFWSQGDGACFSGRWYVECVNYAGLTFHLSEETAKEYGAYAERAKAVYDFADDGDDLPPSLVRYADITHTGRYCHEHSVSFSYDDEEPDDGYTDDAVKEFEDWCRGLMRTIYRALESEYDYFTGEDYAREMLEHDDEDYEEEEEACPT